MLTSTSFAPLYGRFAEIFGRKYSFLAAIFIFEVGSLICGLATSMNVLIVGRAVSGMGGGGIFSLSLIIISDIVSIRDRPKYQGIIGAVFGLASVVGPLLGGLFTDSLSWRWCFWINLPIGAVTFVAVTFLLRFPSPQGSMLSKLQRIDYLGTILIIGATICLLIPLEYGGSTWPWVDWRTLTMLFLSMILFGLVIVAENYAHEPIIPPSLFENRSVYALLAIAMLLGASFFGLMFYLPSYFQMIKGDTATKAGLETIPLVGGVVVFSISSGQLVARFGYYVPPIYFGSIMLTVGSAMMSTLNQHSTTAQQIGYQIIAGIGIGSMIQMRVIGIQSSVSPHNIAVATATSSFCQSLGGSIGVAVVGAVFNNILDDRLGPMANLVRHAPSGIRNYIKDPATLEFVLESYSQAFDASYKVVIPLAALIFFVAMLVKQAKPDRTRKI
eukprot:jgi/Hompol1/2959/HPOL_006250-RA